MANDFTSLFLELIYLQKNMLYRGVEINTHVDKTNSITQTRAMRICHSLPADPAVHLPAASSY